MAFMKNLKNLKREPGEEVIENEYLNKGQNIFTM